MSASTGRAAGGGQPGGNWKPGIYWRRSEIIKDTLYCTKSGHDCIVFSLARAKRLTPSHDAELASCTKAINRVLERVAAENKDSSRCLRFVLTPYGRMLVWARCGEDDQAREVPGNSITLETDPAGFYRALGISPETRQPEPRRDWEVDENGYLIRCKRGANTQGVAELVSPGNLTTSHDARLEECTNQINGILEQCKRDNQRPDLDLAFLVTPPGLFLAWTKNDDSDDPSPAGAITAASDEAAIYEVLGLARPSGAIPWTPLVAVGAAVVGLVVVIAAVAGGVFSGDGAAPAVITSTSTPRTSSPTVVPTSPRASVVATSTPSPTPARPTDTPGPTATSTPAITQTSEPTPTPRLTEPPTPTLRPTGTPVPTVAPVP